MAINLPSKIEKLTKEIADELMKMKGEARGITMKTDWEVVRQDYGDEGLKKVEARMAELGYPVKYSELKTMDFYPIGLDAISVFAIREIFNWDDEQVAELGAKAMKVSLFLKLFFKYFPAVGLLVRETPKMWRKYYSVGDLEITEFHEKEKYAIIALKNWPIPFPWCLTLRGYFSKILQIALNAPVTAKETKCVVLGDGYHEFLLTW